MAEGFLGWFKRRFGGKARPPADFKSPPSGGPVLDLPLADELTATENDVYNGELIFATSSNVEEWRYIGVTQTLYVRFKSGGLYAYYDVPFPVAIAFFKTDSPGRFVHWHLKNKYRYAKIGEMPPMPHHNVVTTLD